MGQACITKYWQKGLKVKSSGPGVGTGSSRDGDEGTAEEERDSKLPDAGGQGRNRQETPECRDRTSKGRNLKGGRVLQEF